MSQFMDRNDEEKQYQFKKMSRHNRNGYDKPKQRVHMKFFQKWNDISQMTSPVSGR